MDTYPVDKAELGNRLRAARAYADLTQEELARRLGYSPPKMHRLEQGNYARELSHADREGLTRTTEMATGMPQIFFKIDLQSLPELAHADRLVQVLSPTERAELEARALETALADESQQSGANVRRTAEPGRGSETR